MEMLLKNKVCLVTGSGRGIGRETVRRFAEEGAIVYAAARTTGCLDDYCRELSCACSTEVIPLYFDVTNEACAKNALMTIRRNHKRLDVLVNNAGIMRDAIIGMIGSQLVHEVFDANVFGVISMIQLAHKLMSRQKSGCIINLASIVGIEGAAGQLVYSASKGAIIALTKAAAKELAPLGIRVNAVAPGLIDTQLLRSLGAEIIAEKVKNIRLGRLGEPADVANVLVFLASDLANYITGEIISVTGGVDV